MNKKILDYFILLKKNNILGATYLFIGENQRQITDILKSVNCRAHESFCNSCWECKKIEAGNHPDLFTVEADPHVIKIEKIREAQAFLALKSFRASRKILFIKDAENFGIEAANAFLKTLEDPPKNSFIAVSTTKLEGLLPTIVSRCRKIFLTPAACEPDRSACVHVQEFLKGMKPDFKDRTQFAAFLWTLIVLIRDQLVSAAAGPNNDLLAKSDYAIMLTPLKPVSAFGILDELLRIYGVHANINENLALHLIRTRFVQAMPAD